MRVKNRYKNCKHEFDTLPCVTPSYAHIGSMVKCNVMAKIFRNLPPPVMHYLIYECPPRHGLFSLFWHSFFKILSYTTRYLPFRLLLFEIFVNYSRIARTNTSKKDSRTTLTIRTIHRMLKKRYLRLRMPGLLKGEIKNTDSCRRCSQTEFDTKYFHLVQASTNQTCEQTNSREHDQNMRCL